MPGAAAPPAAPPAPPPPSRRRRRGRPRPPPNPLFARWLREWRDEAAGTRVRGVYERALASLSRYPLPLRSGRAAAILQHFGPALCRRLELRLRQHRAEQGLPPSPPAEGRGPLPLPAPPTRRPPREYRPLPRSGAHALLLTLHQSPSPLPEAELLQWAEPLCDRPLPPALSTLLRRELLQRRGRPPRFSLTPRGQILAQRLADAASEAPPPAAGQRPLLEEEEEEESAPPPFPLWDAQAPFELRPGEFDVVLCADVTEAIGGRGPALLLRGGPLPLLLRRLPVGDFLWVARERDPPPGRPPRELALEVLVERKAAADLAQSLRDGRYRQQKFRLGRCGLRQPLYLLEEPRGGEQLPLPLPVLRQAAASTQGRVLRAWWGDVAARGPPEPPGTPCALLPFARLRERGGRNQAQRVGEVFARQLLQLGGLSGGGAAALLRRFPTPASLMAAYSSCPSPAQREALLSDVKCGPLQRNLGPSLSAALARLYGTPGALPGAPPPPAPAPPPRLALPPQ